MRPLACIVVIAGAFVLPWWVLLFIALAYAFWFPEAYELFVPAILLDALYGADGTLPFPLLYTLGTACILLVAETAKPYLTFYRE